MLFLVQGENEQQGELQAVRCSLGVVEVGEGRNETRTDTPERPEPDFPRPARRHKPPQPRIPIRLSS